MFEFEGLMDGEIQTNKFVIISEQRVNIQLNKHMLLTAYPEDLYSFILVQ